MRILKLKRVRNIKRLKHLSLQRNEEVKKNCIQTVEQPFLRVSNIYNSMSNIFFLEIRLSKMSGIFSALNGSTLYWMRHKQLKAVPGKML